MRLASFFDKGGSLGAIIATMGCASCFPVIASIGATLGLGFLAQFEGLFINTLLPLFALLGLLTNIWMGIRYKQCTRTLIGIAGPCMVLATLYLFWTDNWSTYMFYAGLILMLAVSIWNFILPPNRVCTPPEKMVDILKQI